MFREIGVNVHIRMGKPARGPNDSCGYPIVIQLEDGTGYQGHEQALAYATPYKESGACIHVFIDRLLVHLNGRLAFSSGLLAHVMVHEITHVLEPTLRHSGEGVSEGGLVRP